MAVTNKRNTFTDPNSYTKLEIVEARGQEAYADVKLPSLKGQFLYNEWNSNLNNKYPDLYNVEEWENFQAAAADILKLPEKEQEAHKKAFYRNYSLYLSELASKVLQHPNKEQILQETSGFPLLTKERIDKAKGGRFGRTYTRGADPIGELSSLNNPESITLKDFVEADSDLSLGFLINANTAESLLQKTDRISKAQVGAALFGIAEESAYDIVTGKALIGGGLPVLANRLKKAHKLSKLAIQLGKGARFDSMPVRRNMLETLSGGIVLKGTGAIIPESDYTLKEAAIHTSIETVLTGGITGLPKAVKAVVKDAPNVVKYLRAGAKASPEDLTPGELRSFKVMYEALANYAEVDGTVAQQASVFVPEHVRVFLNETDDLYKLVNSSYNKVGRLNKLFDTGTKEQIKRYLTHNEELIKFAEDRVMEQGVYSGLKAADKSVFEFIDTADDKVIKDFIAKWEKAMGLKKTKGSENLFDAMSYSINNTSFALWRNGVLSKLRYRILEPLTATAIYTRQNLTRAIGAALSGDFKSGSGYMDIIGFYDGMVETFKMMGKRRPSVETLKKDGVFVSVMDALNDMKVVKGLAVEPGGVPRGKNPLAADRVLTPLTKAELSKALGKASDNLQTPGNFEKAFNNFTEAWQTVSRTVPSITDVLSEGFAVNNTIYHFGRVFQDNLEATNLNLSKLQRKKLNGFFAEYAHIILRENANDDLLGQWMVRFDDEFTEGLSNSIIKETLRKTVIAAEQDIARITVKADLLDPNRNPIVRMIGRLDSIGNKNIPLDKTGLGSLVYANSVGAFIRSGTNLTAEGLQLVLPIDTIKKLRMGGVARQEAIGQIFVTGTFWLTVSNLYKNGSLKKDETRNEIVIPTPEGDYKFKREHPTIHTAVNAAYEFLSALDFYEQNKYYLDEDDDTLTQMTPYLNGLSGAVSSILDDSFLRTIEMTKYTLQAENVGLDSRSAIIYNMMYTPFDTILDLVDNVTTVDGEEIEGLVTQYISGTDSIKDDKLPFLRKVAEELGVPPLEPKYSVDGQPVQELTKFGGIVRFTPSVQQDWEITAQEYGIQLKPRTTKTLNIPGSVQKKKVPREYNRLVAEAINNIPVKGYRTYNDMMNRVVKAIINIHEDNGTPINPVFLEKEMKTYHAIIYDYGEARAKQKLGLYEDMAATELEIFNKMMRRYGK